MSSNLQEKKSYARFYIHWESKEDTNSTQITEPFILHRDKKDKQRKLNGTEFSTHPTWNKCPDVLCHTNILHVFHECAFNNVCNDDGDCEK